MVFKKYSKIRFQECPWYVRLWRWRYYLLVPFKATKFWIYNKYYYFNIPSEEDYLSFNNCLSIAKGLAQSSMKWYYSFDEVEMRIGLHLTKCFEVLDDGNIDGDVDL